MVTPWIQSTILYTGSILGCVLTFCFSGLSIRMKQKITVLLPQITPKNRMDFAGCGIAFPYTFIRFYQ